jgi:hypothetical protein
VQIHEPILVQCLNTATQVAIAEITVAIARIEVNHTIRCDNLSLLTEYLLMAEVNWPKSLELVFYTELSVETRDSICFEAISTLSRNSRVVRPVQCVL